MNGGVPAPLVILFAIEKSHPGADAVFVVGLQGVETISRGMGIP